MMIPRPFRVAALLLALASGCDSGLGHDPRNRNATATVDEAAPESLTRFGFDVGVTLLDPVAGTPAPASGADVEATTITGLGTTLFLAFTTTAAADDADGAGADLDPSAPADTNNVDDVFLAALAQGTRRDVVLVSRASGGAAAANGRSIQPSLAFESNPAFVPANPAGTNPAGWVHVAFTSNASNVAGADNNGGQDDVFRASIAVNVVSVAGVPTIDLVREEAGARAPQRLSVLDTQSGTGAGGTGIATDPRIAGAGDLVAFVSTDTNLVAGDANGVRDLFLRRPSLSRTARVTTGNGHSDAPVLTDDLVPVLAFESDASNLGVVDSNAKRDIYFAALDVATLTPDPLARASLGTGNVQLDGDSRRPALNVITADADGAGGGADGIDGDGKVEQLQVAFETDATNLGPRPTPSTTNVYLYDSRGGGKAVLLNQRVGPGGATLGSADGGASPCDSFRPTFRPGGRAVAFETLADNLDLFRPADGNDAADVVVADIRSVFVDGSLAIHRISVTDTGADGNGASTRPLFVPIAGAGAVSGGVTPYFSEGIGQFLTFDRCQQCHAFFGSPPLRPPGHPGYNLGDDCSACHDPLLDDLGNADEWDAPPPALDFRNKSIDQLCAQFRDTPNDAGGIREHLTGGDARIVWALESGSFDSIAHVGFSAVPTVLQHFGLTRAEWDAIVNAWVDNGFQCRPFGAGGGDLVLFETAATNLGAATGDSHVIGFPDAIRLERLSKTSGFPPSGGKQATRAAFAPSITRDDRFVAFATSAPLDAARDGNNAVDVYVRDLLLGTTTLVSHAAGSGLAATGTSTHPSAAVAPDGTLFVAFESNALNLVSGFVNGNGAAADVYLADFSTFDGANPATITVTLVSATSGVPTGGGDGASLRPSLAVAAIGPQIAFESVATDLVAGFVDGNGAAAADVFVNDVAASGMRLVSSTFLAPLAGGNGASGEPALSDDGLFLAFTSAASDLVAAFVDANGAGTDVFVRDLALDATALGSGKDGVPGTGGDGASSHPTLDGDGSVLAFESLASDLIPGFVDGNGAPEPDLFAVDFTFATVALVSESTGGAGFGGDGASRAPSLSPDGNVVVFESDATDLLAGDTNLVTDVWLRDRGASSTRRLSLSIGGIEPRAPSTAPRIGSDAGQIVFESLADNLVGANVDTNGVGDVYRAQR